MRVVLSRGRVPRVATVVPWISAAQLVLLVAFALVIFSAGVTIGLQVFDSRGAAGAAALPPGLVATAGGASRLRRQLQLEDAAPPAASAAGSAAAAARAAAAAAEAAAASALEAAAAAGAAAAPPPSAASAASAASAEAVSGATPDFSAAAAGAAAGAAGAAVEALPPLPPPPTSWAEFGGGENLVLGSNLDGAEVSAGAWIFLDGSSMKETINTVLSNRPGGCAVDAAHAGYTLHVNNWATRDRALVLEWRDASPAASAGCSRLSSEPGAVPLGEWVHVGFAFKEAKEGPGDRTEGKAMLFLNGRLLRTGSTRRGAADVQTQSRRASVGATLDQQFHFAGRIAQLFVTHGVITPKQLAATYCLTDEAGFVELAKAARDKLLGLVVLGHKADGQPLMREDGPAALALAAGTLPQSSMQQQPGGSRNIVAELSGKALPEGMVAFSPVTEREAADRLAARIEARAARGASNGSGGGAIGADAVPDSIARDSVPGTPSSVSAFDFTKGGNQWVRRMVRLPLEMASGSTSDAKSLAEGTFSDEVTQAELEASDSQGRVRALAVKEAMQHAWKGYKERAWGMDELKPRSGAGDNNWSGLGMTLVDSLDTLWIMGMKEEFAEARAWVATSLEFNKQGALSVFEVTIRVLGGLLAAWDLSGDAVFLDKARQLGDRLLPAFNTPTGIPRAQITLATGWAANPSWTGGSAILSELGTLQLEFRHLSKATGQPHYGAKAEAVIERLDAVNPTDGLYPIYISADSGMPTTGAVTFGALGDSFYEYLIKAHVQGGLVEPRFRTMYDEAMDGMTRKLLKHSRPSELAFVADWNGGNAELKMDHLVCFVPGMLALGAFNAAGAGAGEEHAARDLKHAKQLAYTCWQMYQRQATGIAPEFVEFPGGADLVAAARAPFYILRPEAAESLFVLHQLTGNPVYREWGWKMFEAIERGCRTSFAYGAHPDVRDPGRVPDDRMESFFLAETLKYLYMLQSPDHEISLEKYVFNTEAHPLSIFTQKRWF